MNSMKKAKGITLIGFLFALGILGIFLYAGMQIVPVYMDHQSVIKAMRAVADEGGARTPAAVKTSLAKRLSISYVDHVKPSDFKVVRGNGLQLKVQYEVEREFVGNLSFKMRFQDSVAL